jgi:competence protein ComEC
MHIHQKYPFLRILAGVVCGILVEENFSPGKWIWIVVSCFGLIILLAHQKLNDARKWQFRFAPGAGMTLMLICLGGYITMLAKKNNEPALLSNSTDYIVYKITDGPSKTKTGSRYTARMYDIENPKLHANSHVFIYINKDTSGSFEPGDLLLGMNQLNIIKPSKDALAFDFYTYAKRKQIHFTLHCEKWQLVKILNSRSYLSAIIFRLRIFFLETLRKNIADKRLCGLAEAMLTGYREDLDRDILKAYTDTGVVHIIAISGLHLGLIFWLADLFLRKLVPNRFVPLAGLLIILPMLWIFAVMTGSSASIMRSVSMFSISICGNALGKKNSSMNALLCSAALLLLTDPLMIYDIGFQLSYAAVASILIFERPLRNVVYLKNKIAVYCWSMVSITLAAQVLTTPFVIYHFHRFPVLFLFSNLVAVPLSSIILVLEIILCCAETIHLGAPATGRIIAYLMTGMNDYVSLMHQIPFNLVTGIYVDFLILLLTIVTAGLLLQYFIKPSKSVLLVFGVMMVLTLVFRINNIYNHERKHNWIILQSAGNTHIIHRHGKNATILVKNSKSKELRTVEREIEPAINALAIEKINWKQLPDFPFVLELPYVEDSEKKSALLISGVADLKIKAITNTLNKPTLMLSDGTNNLWKIRQWEKESQELNLRFLSTSLTGSITINCHH